MPLYFNPLFRTKGYFERILVTSQLASSNFFIYSSGYLILVNGVGDFQDYPHTRWFIRRINKIQKLLQS